MLRRRMDTPGRLREYRSVRKSARFWSAAVLCRFRMTGTFSHILPLLAVRLNGLEKLIALEWIEERGYPGLCCEIPLGFCSREACYGGGWTLHDTSRSW